jgi:hypothetical protein
VVVNAVEGGGHRAHCLRCGAIGPVRETTDAARQAISSCEGHADLWVSDDTLTLERGEGLVSSQEVRLGTRVRVREGHGRVELRGLLGTLEQRWGNSDYPAFLVWLEDGRFELFWDYELEEVEEGSPTD